MSTAQKVSLKIIKNKIKRTLTLLTVLRLSPIVYEKEIQELEQKLERYRQKYMELKVKELRKKRECLKREVMNMLTIQAKINWFSTDLWADVYICKTEEEAKEYIQKKVQMGRPAEEFRIITGFITCQTKVVFISETEKLNKDDNPIVNTETGTFPVEIEFVKTPDDTKSAPKRKNYTEEELKLLYFKRSCELMRWAKSTDFFDTKEYPTWTTFNNYLGNITNVKDLVVRELKKEPVPRVYRELIDKYFDRYTSGLKVLEEFKERR